MFFSVTNYGLSTHLVYTLLDQIVQDIFGEQILKQ
jgi:hypothetical protein